MYLAPGSSSSSIVTSTGLILCVTSLNLSISLGPCAHGREAPTSWFNASTSTWTWCWLLVRWRFPFRLRRHGRRRYVGRHGGDVCAVYAGADGWGGAIWDALSRRSSDDLPYLLVTVIGDPFLSCGCGRLTSECRALVSAVPVRTLEWSINSSHGVGTLCPAMITVIIALNKQRYLD